MVLYRDKYILDGLDEIPDDMLDDLDLAYDVCSKLRDTGTCVCCGKCCHQPYITVMDGEVGRMSEYLGMDEDGFIRHYLHRVDERWLFRKDKDEKCAFLGEDMRCTIWPGRPEICRDFPYMVSKLMSSVYLAIAYPGYEIDLSYMDDGWPCTPGIKNDVFRLIQEAVRERNA